MIHQRKRLPLGFESSDYLSSIHAWFDNLQSNLSPHWTILLGDELRRVFVRRENPFVRRWLTW